MIASSRLLAAYEHATRAMIAAGFSHELDWQRQLSFKDISEQVFLREAAWVILSAGMREAVIRLKFPLISVAFLDWQSAAEIYARRHSCRARALRAFNHEKKIAAIVGIAQATAEGGFTAIREAIETEGINYIGRLPFIGPTTRWHLAKNLGLDVVKPDRHLTRIATAGGFASPNDLCRTIARLTGDKVAVIDLVLWRYATIDLDYVSLFRRD